MLCLVQGRRGPHPFCGALFLSTQSSVPIFFFYIHQLAPLLAGQWKIAGPLVATSLSNDQKRIQQWVTRNLPRLSWCQIENITGQLSPTMIQLEHCLPWTQRIRLGGASLQCICISTSTES